MKFISTSALAKEKDLDPKELFSILKSKGWIYKKNDTWHLTKEGIIAGGKMTYNPKYGEYPTWPLGLDINQVISKDESTNSTGIGKEFGISAQKVNTVFAELGWIEKSQVGGWNITKFGSRNGGTELEAQNGSPYVIWDKAVLQNSSFLQSVNAATGRKYDDDKDSITTEHNGTDEFRLKYEAK